MCLITFSWQPETEHPLILAANRDELYSRPTLPVHYWEEDADVLGGKDLQGGGSWLAINRKGRFAAITNFREVPVIKNKLSRGKLVSDFVIGTQVAEEYIKGISIKNNDYPGFNLLLGDESGIHYYSNRNSNPIKLKPGLYGLSNHLLNTPWPKVEKSTKQLSYLLNSHNQNPNIDMLMTLMHDCSTAPDSTLPDTGVGLKLERLLSSCFIKSASYGTRNISIIKINSTGKLKWAEHIYGANGKTGKQLSFSTTFSHNWYESSIVRQILNPIKQDKKPIMGSTK